MQKYAFSIKTRSGQFIERIVIAGKDREDAERKLNQMYRYCEIVNCEQLSHAAAQKRMAAAIDDSLSMMYR